MYRSGLYKQGWAADTMLDCRCKAAEIGLLEQSCAEETLRTDPHSRTMLDAHFW